MRDEHWFERKRREAEAWSNAIFEAWLREAVFAAHIDLPLRNTVWVMCGYDPQRLLTDSRLRSYRWTAADGSLCYLLVGRLTAVEPDEGLARFFDIPLGEPYRD